MISIGRSRRGNGSAGECQTEGHLAENSSFLVDELLDQVLNCHFDAGRRDERRANLLHDSSDNFSNFTSRSFDTFLGLTENEMAERRMSNRKGSSHFLEFSIESRSHFSQSPAIFFSN